VSQVRTSASTNSSIKPLVGPEDAAKLAGLSIPYLGVLRMGKKGPHYIKVGWRVFYQPDKVLKWAAAHAAKKAARAANAKNVKRADFRREISELRRVGDLLLASCTHLERMTPDLLEKLTNEWNSIPRAEVAK